MEKKLTIQATQFYYYKLIQNFFYYIRDNQYFELKKYYFRVFLKRMQYDKEKLLKNSFVLKQFSKCLGKQYAFEKLKDNNEKKLYMRSFFYMKFKSLKIMIMKNTHIDFFKRIKYLKNFKSISSMNLTFFKKKIYIDFFKKICRSITIRNYILKKCNNVDEIYKINLMTKYFKKIKLASQLSFERTCHNIRKYLVSKKIFYSLKNIYV